MLNINITITGDRKTITQLKQMSDSFKNWKPELQQIGDYLKEFYANEVFETEGAIIGSRWSPLSPNYEFQKRKKYPGRGILEATGDLRKGYKVKARKNTMELTNPTPYGVFHQQGRGVPKRVLLRLDESRKDDVVKIFKQGLVKKVRKAIV